MKRIDIIISGTVAVLLFLAVFSSCHKDTTVADDPSIKNDSVNVQINEATFYWDVVYIGKVSSVVELSNNQNMSDATRYGSEALTDNKKFIALVVGLSENCTYYYRFLVWNPAMEYKSEIKSFTTRGYSLPKVTTSKVIDITENSASCGGIVVSESGELLEKGICWGTEHNPTVEGTHISSPMEGDSFTVNMTDLSEGVTYYVRAYAINIKGTAYGEEVNFFTRKPSPVGTINGLFSVSETQQVYFSKGNLQFRAIDWFSPNNYYWKLAERQYDIVGMGNTNISVNYDNFIDLFGWATSMCTSTSNTYSLPYETAYGDGHDNKYGPGENDLVGTYKEYDWGFHNAIINGGNQAGLWRTMTNAEWNYVINTREASSVNGTENARFAKGCVEGVYGVILFPDQYTHPEHVPPLYGINSQDALGWMTNSYTDNDWELMEQAGAVFLPVTGYRTGTDVHKINSVGYYWTATHYNETRSDLFYFNDSDISANVNITRGTGCAVRLVMDYQKNKKH